eukprot:NODE_15_length_50561_cov_0.608081.p9 type:complete len:454 gc:universal NODE_15_length_50561_cov_0.608081:22136-23497(+)
MRELIEFLNESKLPQPKRKVSVSKKHRPLMQKKRISIHENNSVLKMLKTEYNNSKKVVRSAGQNTLNRDNRNSNALSLTSMSISNLSMMSDGSIDSFISDLDEEDEKPVKPLRYKNQPAHYTTLIPTETEKNEVTSENIKKTDLNRDNAQNAAEKRISPPRPPKPMSSELAEVADVIHQSIETDEEDITDISSLTSSSDSSQSLPAAHKPLKIAMPLPQPSPQQSAAQQKPLKSVTKRVQFSDVDVIKRDTSLEELGTVDLNDDLLDMKDWMTSRSTQTQQNTCEEYTDLSKEELVSQLTKYREECFAAQESLHLLVDENGEYAKKYDIASRQNDELFIKHDQVMSQYTLLKSDYNTAQNTLIQTRQQLQQATNKSTDLEKLSTRALKKIKDLDGENKFLSMQVEWLRNKLVNLNVQDDDDMDDSSYSSSTTMSSFEKPAIRRKRLKKKEASV